MSLSRLLGLDTGKPSPARLPIVLEEGVAQTQQPAAPAAPQAAAVSQAAMAALQAGQTQQPVRPTPPDDFKRTPPPAPAAAPAQPAAQQTADEQGAFDAAFAKALESQQHVLPQDFPRVEKFSAKFRDIDELSQISEKLEQHKRVMQGNQAVWPDITSVELELSACEASPPKSNTVSVWCIASGPNFFPATGWYDRSRESILSAIKHLAVSCPNLEQISISADQIDIGTVKDDEGRRHAYEDGRIYRDGRIGRMFDNGIGYEILFTLFLNARNLASIEFRDYAFHRLNASPLLLQDCCPKLASVRMTRNPCHNAPDQNPWGLSDQQMPWHIGGMYGFGVFGIPQLRELHLACTDEGMKRLPKHPGIVTLHVRGHYRDLTSSGLAMIGRLPNLRNLTLRDCAGIKDFSCLSRIPLRSLTLWGVRAPVPLESIISQVRETLQHLEIREMTANDSRWDEDTFKEIGRCEQLSSLHLAFCGASRDPKTAAVYTDESLLALKGCQSLRSFVLWGGSERSRWTHNGFIELALGLPELEVLDLEHSRMPSLWRVKDPLEEQCPMLLCITSFSDRRKE